MSAADAPVPGTAGIRGTSGTAAPSLRRRLSRFVLLLALTWTVAATLLLTAWLRYQVHQLLDDSLVATSEALATVLQSAGYGPLQSQEQGATTFEAETPFAWQLVDGSGQLLTRSSNAPERRLAERLQPGFVPTWGGWRVRARALPGGRWLLVGQQASERVEVTMEVAGGAALVAALVSLGGLGWLRWRMARETQPLADLRGVLARYDPLQAEVPLPPPALLELAAVHEAVQQLGERLAMRAAAERAFSAHAAHALRTPLAGVEAQLAVAQREAPPALQPRLARLRAATARLSHVVTALLALFRSGGELKLRPLDVAALLARVPPEGLALEIEGNDARPVADPDLLAAALFNLLDNAVRHGAHRVHVQVTPGHLTVTDDGPGVSAERLASLRQALQRDGDANPDGAAHDVALAGLGLALADRVARAHGGRLELLSVAAGFGARLWLAPAHDAVAPPLPEVRHA